MNLDLRKIVIIVISMISQTIMIVDVESRYHYQHHYHIYHHHSGAVTSEVD